MYAYGCGYRDQSCSGSIRNYLAVFSMRTTLRARKGLGGILCHCDQRTGTSAGWDKSCNVGSCRGFLAIFRECVTDARDGLRRMLDNRDDRGSLDRSSR